MAFTLQWALDSARYNILRAGSSFTYEEIFADGNILACDIVIEAMLKELWKVKLNETLECILSHSLIYMYVGSP